VGWVGGDFPDTHERAQRTRPSVLVTEMVLPIFSARDLDMARPRPIPFLFARELEPRRKGRKTCSTYKDNVLTE
jgi:hypothetical protein